MIPEWMRIERRLIQQRERRKRKRVREAQARAFAEGAYAAAVAHYTRLAGAWKHHHRMPLP